jgi:hypothetical protein
MRCYEAYLPGGIAVFDTISATTHPTIAHQKTLPPSKNLLIKNGGHLGKVGHLVNQKTLPFPLLYGTVERERRLHLSHRPHLQNISNQPVDLSWYEKLLKYSW